MMKAFPELVTMIKALVRSLRAISSAFILIFFMTYVWAILLHMLLEDETEFNNDLDEELGMSFRGMLDCIWILLMDGTLMLDSPVVASQLLYSGKFNMVLA